MGLRFNLQPDCGFIDDDHVFDVAQKLTLT